MSKTRIYFIQLIGIIMLLCGYLMRDQPDRLSLMHFDPNAQHSVISKAVRMPKGSEALKIASNSRHGHHHHKSKAPKQVVYNVSLPHIANIRQIHCEPVVHNSLLRENYNYLFYREINPPPPRSC